MPQETSHARRVVILFQCCAGRVGYCKGFSPLQACRPLSNVVMIRFGYRLLSGAMVETVGQSDSFDVLWRWATIIAFITFIQVLANFLDEYHIPSQAKERVQIALRKGFTALEKLSVGEIINLIENHI